MNVFIINSAPGVGKTSLMNNLQSRLKKGYAFLDGDDLGRVIPHVLNTGWLNLIQDNIVSCIDNFDGYKIKNCIVSFVFPTKERLERLYGLLRKRNHEIYHIILFCEKNRLIERIKRRNSQKIIEIRDSPEYDSMIRELNCDYKFDTSDMNVHDLCDEVYRVISDIGEV